MKNWATPLGLAGFGSRSEADRTRQQFSDWRVVAVALLVFAGYFLGAKIGFALTFRPHPISVLWPPNSILLAVFLLTPVRIWWVILLAAFPAHLAAQMESGVPLTMILCWFISNSCEAFIGASFIRYLIDRPVRFDCLRNVGIFCLFAAFLGPFLSSFLDTAFVSLNHWGQGSYWEIWRIRFTSNVLAALTVAPLIVTFSAIWGATHGHGPFAGGSPEQNALAVQVFLIVLSVPLIFLAAVVEERANVEQRSAKVFRSSPDAMLVIRRKDSCIIDVNEHWQTIFGYRREEAIQHTMSDFYPNRAKGDLERLIADTSEEKPLHDLELSLRTKTGDMR